MSAFTLCDAHIDAMLNGAMLNGAMTLHRKTFANGGFTWYFGDLDDNTGELTPATADRVGSMLLAGHEGSLCHEYGGDAGERLYRFTPDRRPVDPVRILKATRCYVYQSCEHPGWEAGEARRSCDALADLAISRLPGYAEAPWALTRMADVLEAR
jgi:hypothetical protein